MAPYVQHYYCHGCHEYIEAMADDNDGYDSDSDEEWEQVMEQCPSCGSPFFELLNSQQNEVNPPSMNTTPSQTNNNTTNTTGRNSNNHARNRNSNTNNTSNVNNTINTDIPFPPNMPQQVRNMIRNVIGQNGIMSHQMNINIGVMQGQFPSNRDNGLPASCKDFTADDVVNILNSYPEGVPRVESAMQQKNVWQKQQQHQQQQQQQQQQQTASPTNPGPIPNDGVCTVCLESVYAPCSSQVVQMHCSHCYHKLCIKSWFEKGVFTCPTCRQPAIKDDA